MIIAAHVAADRATLPPSAWCDHASLICKYSFLNSPKFFLLGSKIPSLPSNRCFWSFRQTVLAWASVLISWPQGTPYQTSVFPPTHIPTVITLKQSHGASDHRQNSPAMRVTCSVNSKIRDLGQTILVKGESVEYPVAPGAVRVGCTADGAIWITGEFL